VTPDNVAIGVAIAPNAAGAVLPMSAARSRLERLEAEGDEHPARDRDRCAEPRERLQERAERERHDQCLDALVGGGRANRLAQRVEMAGHDRHPVDPHRVDDDPRDREEPEGRAFGGTVERLPSGHLIHADRDHECDRERAGNRAMGRPPKARQEHEQRDERQDRGDRAQSERAA
jgi:hypothetical protein